MFKLSMTHGNPYSVEGIGGTFQTVGFKSRGLRAELHGKMMYKYRSDLLHWRNLQKGVHVSQFRRVHQ